MRGNRFALLALAVALGAAPSLNAQSPIITPDGDPSIRSDTIYSLAVDPADHPEEIMALLLDDGVVRFEADGTGTRTYRMVAQILKQQAVATWSEFTFRYHGEREEFVLNWARVVKPDGTVVSEKPIHVQEMDAPVPEQSPVYTNHKVVRISLGNVAPGHIVDYSYTTRTRKTVVAGDVTSQWSITTGGTVRRSRLVVDAPRDMKLNIREKNLDFTPEVKQIGSRIVRTWAAADIPRIEPELFAADSNAVYQRVAISGSVTWADIGYWYAGLARDRYTLTPELLDKLKDLTATASTRFDSLRAVYRWVAQDVRYVSLSLGEGSYQPRVPVEVFTTMAGDCKDKASLFIALARRLGYQAFPVLISASGEVNPDMPSVAAFDHVIAAVKLNGEWTYLDLTADIVPFGDTPPATVGEFGLLVYDDGRSEEVRLPELKSADNTAVVHLSGSVNEDGAFSGRFSRRVTGLMQYQMRSDFAETLTDKQVDDMTAALAAQVIEGAIGDSLRVSRGYDLDVAPFLDLKITAEQTLKPAADGFLFYLPMPKYSSPQLVAQLQRERTRRFPFDAGKVFGPITVSNELVLTLPAGWRADLPKPVTAESVFGRFDSSYQQVGETVTIRRTMRGSDEVVDMSAKPVLIQWLRELGRDDAGFIIVRPPAAALSH